MAIRLEDIKDPKTRKRVQDALGAGAAERPAGEAALKNPAGGPKGSVAASAPVRFRQRTKPLLNGLETAWLRWLEDWVQGPIWQQAIRLRLANGCYYTPDLAAMVDGRLTFWEVKGPWATDDAVVKFKMAAHEYPEFRFIMAWKDDQKIWQIQEARP